MKPCKGLPDFGTHCLFPLPRKEGCLSLPRPTVNWPNCLILASLGIKSLCSDPIGLFMGGKKSIILIIIYLFLVCSASDPWARALETSPLSSFALPVQIPGVTQTGSGSLQQPAPCATHCKCPPPLWPSLASPQSPLLWCLLAHHPSPHPSILVCLSFISPPLQKGSHLRTRGGGPFPWRSSPVFFCSQKKAALFRLLPPPGGGGRVTRCLQDV